MIRPFPLPACLRTLLGVLALLLPAPAAAQKVTGSDTLTLTTAAGAAFTSLSMTFDAAGNATVTPAIVARWTVPSNVGTVPREVRARLNTVPAGFGTRTLTVAGGNVANSGTSAGTAEVLTSDRAFVYNITANNTANSAFTFNFKATNNIPAQTLTLTVSYYRADGVSLVTRSIPVNVSAYTLPASTVDTIEFVGASSAAVMLTANDAAGERGFITPPDLKFTTSGTAGRQIRVRQLSGGTPLSVFEVNGAYFPSAGTVVDAPIISATPTTLVHSIPAGTNQGAVAYDQWFKYQEGYDCTEYVARYEITLTDAAGVNVAPALVLPVQFQCNSSGTDMLTMVDGLDSVNVTFDAAGNGTLSFVPSLKYSAVNTDRQIRVIAASLPAGVTITNRYAPWAGNSLGYRPVSASTSAQLVSPIPGPIGNVTGPLDFTVQAASPLTPTTVTLTYSLMTGAGVPLATETVTLNLGAYGAAGDTLTVTGNLTVTFTSQTGTLSAAPALAYKTSGAVTAPGATTRALTVRLLQPLPAGVSGTVTYTPAAGKGTSKGAVTLSTTPVIVVDLIPANVDQLSTALAYTFTSTRGFGSTNITVEYQLIEK